MNILFFHYENRGTARQAHCRTVVTGGDGEPARPSTARDAMVRDLTLAQAGDQPQNGSPQRTGHEMDTFCDVFFFR